MGTPPDENHGHADSQLSLWSNDMARNSRRKGFLSPQGGMLFRHFVDCVVYWAKETAKTKPALRAQSRSFSLDQER